MRSRSHRLIVRWTLPVILFLIAPVAALAQAPRQTENVFLITLDGLRWQELFTGADPLLLDDERYVGDVERTRASFWDNDPAVRREKLMPFFWEVIAGEGQLYGDRPAGCEVDVTNTMWFSYPGYNEILSGRADDERIHSNDKVPNPNVTVLEYLNRQPGFQGKVAAFGSWDVFPYIVNEERSGIPVNAGFEAAVGSGLTARERFLNELQEQIPSPWSSVRLDAFTHNFALEHLKKYHPRVLYVAYGETDDFAHGGDYQAYLEAAHRTDSFIRDLWEYAQSDPQYAGKTTILVTTDHGRGERDAWTGHGSDVTGADAIWIAALGPDTPARGVVESCALEQNQVAATVAALLGLDYVAGRQAGAPISFGVPE